MDREVGLEVQILPLPLTGCVTLGKLLTFLCPNGAIFKMAIMETCRAQLAGFL